MTILFRNKFAVSFPTSRQSSSLYFSRTSYNTYPARRSFLPELGFFVATPAGAHEVRRCCVTPDHHR